MTFADLQPGDEITVFLAAQLKETCRAKVLKHCGDYVAALLWNSVAQRWGNKPSRVKPHRVLQYPQRMKKPRR
jgi:hypothetical protein